MNGIVAAYTQRQIHGILDHLNTHKPKHDRWRQRHKNVCFHYLPTPASWLNQVEIWFSLLSRPSLAQASFTSPQQLRQHIDAFIAAYNQNPIGSSRRNKPSSKNTPKYHALTYAARY